MKIGVTQIERSHSDRQTSKSLPNEKERMWQSNDWGRLEGVLTLCRIKCYRSIMTLVTQTRNFAILRVYNCTDQKIAYITKLPIVELA